MGLGLGRLNPVRVANKVVDKVGDIGQGAIDTAKDLGAGLDRTIRDKLPGGWTTAALLAAGYYYSPEINAYLSADGATMAAGADVAAADAAATVAAEQAAAAAAAEQLAAQQAALGVTSSVSAEALAAANATADPLGALIAEQGWSVVDPAYLAAIGVTEGMTPAVAAGVSKGLTFAQAADLARAGLLVNAVAGDPLGLGGGQPEQAPAGSTGFAMVPIPAEWKSPTYAASSAPIDLSTIFSNQNMLGGTQWQDLPSQRNVSFNDIFASGQQQTPMGTPVDISQIVNSIINQESLPVRAASSMPMPSAAKPMTNFDLFEFVPVSNQGLPVNNISYEAPSYIKQLISSIEAKQANGSIPALGEANLAIGESPLYYQNASATTSPNASGVTLSTFR